MTAVQGGQSAQRRLAGMLIISAIGLSVAPGPVWSWEGDIARIAQITLDAEAAPRAVPGVSASIVFKDGKKWSGAAGYADKDRTKKMTVDDQMRIGSQTKTYTGTVILQMVDQGKISLDDTLSKWMPDSGVPQADQITIRNLLSMTSGIPDYLRAPAAALTAPTCPANDPSAPTVLDQWVVDSGMMTATATQLIKAASCLGNTGRGTMAYSNTNFVVLGKIAEKIACGENPPANCYIDLLQHDVIDRVSGLNRTSFPSTADFASAPFSSGYARVQPSQGKVTGMNSLGYPDADAYLDFSRVDPAVPSAAGAMISSASDETIWASQLIDNKFKLLSDEMQRKRLNETQQGNVAGIPARYGLAVYYMRSLLNNAVMVGHSGSIVGYTSNVFRRPDTGTNYAANVPTFSLADQFSAPALVWVLDRNVSGAIHATGNCSSGASGATPSARPLVCSGDSVRLSSLAVGHDLTLRPSGKSYDTYVPGGSSTQPGDVVPTIVARVPVPTLAFYGHHQSAVALTGAARLAIEPDAALAMVGNQSAAVDLKGSQNTVSIAGSVTTSGRDVAGLRDAGAGNTMTVGGRITGSVVWWNPDLPLMPSVDMVAVPDDGSATIDLAGSNGKLKIDGMVWTQRIKTTAVNLQRQARGYNLSIGPKGAVVGPIVLAGSEATLSIAPGGLGLYVKESGQLAPRSVTEAAQSRMSPQALNFALRGPPAPAPTDEYMVIGVPGIPPIRRPPPALRPMINETLTTGTGLPPPAMLTLSGNRNTVVIEGALIGAIPPQPPPTSTYTAHVVAVDDGGTGNSLSIGPKGIVIGDITLHGQATRLRIDGTAQGDVTVTGPSIVLTGNGTIKGRLTIDGKPVSQHGSLKIVAAQ